MANSSSHESSSDQGVPDQDVLAELRKLLVVPEQAELRELQERFDNPKLRAQELSKLLPEAIILRSLQQDQQLSEALLPSVEDAIKASVKKDVSILVDAIFPVIGPAIRKSIAVALETLTQSLNQTLEYSLSVQSFKWRLEARQTGKSLAEVILLRTLVYQVEQVFLIHKKTGLMLQHVVADTAAAQDADLVSAMLTAIADFVQDSFSVPKGDSLETLQFGELTIWIEAGPQAVLAGVMRGNAPKELRLLFQNTIEKIQLEFQRELDSFQGEDAPFAATRHYLEDCLQAQYKPKKAKSSPLLWVLLGSIVVALGVWSFASIQDKQRWTGYLERLNAQPGLVVITAERRYGKYFISGLRDPLAADPVLFMKPANLDPKEVISRWEPYLSFDPRFITARAKQLLQPPKTVSLKVDKNGILHLAGSAPQQWIVEAKKLARVIPGISQFQDDNLIKTNLQQLELSKEEIENQVLGFEAGNTQLKPDQDDVIKTLTIEIQKLADAAPFYNKALHVEVIGHTDEDGSAKENRVLSQARAYTILSILVSKGIRSNVLAAVGVGIDEPLFNDFQQKDRELNRSVTFKVFLTDASRITPAHQ